MITKTITYRGYDGVEYTEDFLFNISKAELTEMELGHETSMLEHINKIVKETNREELLKHFKLLITKSYGVKSADQKQFVKNDEELSKFIHSEAYSELFMELVTDAEAASAFVNGVLA